jgi:hypothetical protein
VAVGCLLLPIAIIFGDSFFFGANNVHSGCLHFYRYDTPLGNVLRSQTKEWSRMALGRSVFII